LLKMPPSFPLAMVSPERLAVWPASTVTIAEANEKPAARSTVRLVAPGPWMAIQLSLRSAYVTVHGSVVTGVQVEGKPQ
jgi:hypothetical protein